MKEKERDARWHSSQGVSARLTLNLHLLDDGAIGSGSRDNMSYFLVIVIREVGRVVCLTASASLWLSQMRTDGFNINIDSCRKKSLRTCAINSSST